MIAVKMENDVGSNDADSDNRSFSDSVSSAGRNERGKIPAPVLSHELIIDDSDGDLNETKKLDLNGEGEMWLRIRYTHDSHTQDHMDKKKEKSNGAKTSFQAVMQTQELSPSQTPMTQMKAQTQDIGAEDSMTSLDCQNQLMTQMKTQTQESETQDSMTLLEYLNQPTQDENATDTVTMGTQTSFEIVSGKVISDLYSESKQSPLSSSRAPNATAFLCFEKVSAPGAAAEDCFMTVKDMRQPNDSSNLCEEEIDIWRADQKWEPLLRRKLTILCPGDQIRIKRKRSEALKTQISTDPETACGTSVMFFLGYKRLEKYSIAMMAEEKTLDAKKSAESDSGIEMDMDSENGSPKGKAPDRRDDFSSPSAGMTEEGTGGTCQDGSDGVRRRKILLSQDSAVNAQQESLRSSRMELLNLDNAVGDEKAGVEIVNSAKPFSVQNEGVLDDGRGHDDSVQNGATTNGGHVDNGADDNSDTTVLDENYNALFANDTKKGQEEDIDLENDLSQRQETETKSSDAMNGGVDDGENKKNSEHHDEREHSSDTTVALSVGSDDSSEATIPLTQEVDHGKPVKNHSAKATTVVRDMLADGTDEESDKESILGTVIMMHKTLDSFTAGENTVRTVENRSHTQDADNFSKLFDKNTLISSKNGEDVEKVQPKVGDEVEASKSAEDTTDVRTGSTGKDTKKDDCLKNRRITRSNRLETMSSVDNDDSRDSNTPQVGMKRKTASAVDSPVLMESNRDEVEGAILNKRHRTIESKKENTMRTSIAAVTSDADELYKKRFHTAIESKMIHVLVSGFEQDEMALISKLCKTKFSNVKKFKICETFNKNVTVCIFPTSLNDKEEASRRTLKAIQCALLGVPLVPLAWLEQCAKDRKIVAPTTYIRTLPTQKGTLAMSNQARYGVAKLAAARLKDPQNPSLLFQNTSVFLCGKYERDKKRDLTHLLKEGGATVTTTSREAGAMLESISESSGKMLAPHRRLVLLVGGCGAPIPKLLESKILFALKEAKSRSILVVDSSWVSVSIACASMLPPSDFKPKFGADMWQLSVGLRE